MSLMNVLNDFPYRPRYYLKHPLRFFKEIGWNFQAAWNRATKGYTYSDAAEMSEYLLHLLPQLLRAIANGDAYPGVEPFETYEKWQDWCNSLADVFESAQEENWNTGRNEFEEDLDKALEVLYPNKNLTMTHEMSEKDAREYVNLFWAREKELQKEREKIIKDAFSELAKYYFMLWI